MHWFDAHLDLACLALNGRDMSKPLAALTEADRGPWPPPSVTLPSLGAGGVRACLATIFTESGGKGPEGYPEGDADAAHEAGLRQLKVYEDWFARGLAHRAVIAPSPRAGVGSVLPPSTPAGEVSPAKRATEGAAGSPIALAILIECADPIRSPDELRWWVEKGVVAIGLTWGNGSRYAGGNSKGDGLSDLGREMVRAMDALGVVHDLSHLSQRATDELLELTSGRVIASHSNCRALLGGTDNPWWQRHISDEVIKEVGRRGGVIGLNLCANFIRHDLDKSKGERPTIARAIDHVECVCELMGHRRGVGLGSDLDGGFSADWLPAGMSTPSDLGLLLDELRRRGWSEDECAGFAHGNWEGFWRVP